MNVNVLLKGDQVGLLKKLKEFRHTTNSNQIFREALYEYAEKILPGYVHVSTGNKEKDVKNER